MLSAFTARPIIELKQRDKSKIETILAHGDRVLVGLNSGSLRIYRLNELPPSSNRTNGSSAQSEPAARSPSKATSDGNGRPAVKPTDLLREVEKFSTRAIEQLAVIKEASTIVSLSNYHVSLHDLQTYELVETLARTKNAACFAVTSDIVQDSATGIPEIISRLAVAVKRKLLLWSWHESELSPDVNEVVVAESIRSVTWASATKVVCGMNSGYVLVDVASNEVTDIVGPGSLGGSAAGQSRFGAVSSASMGYMGLGGYMPKPLAAKLSEGEMLLAKDINTLFVSADGKPREKRQIPWQSAPESIGYSYPYVVALQPPSKGSLEVRNPDTLSLLQTITLPGAAQLYFPPPTVSLAHAGKGFHISSERCVWKMDATNYDSQVDELVGLGKYDEAVSVLNMLEDALLRSKTETLREVKMLKAESLFKSKRYRDSLDLFNDESVHAPPERVLRLYPPVIAGELSAWVKTEDGSEGDEHAAGTNGEDGKADKPGETAEAPASPKTGGGLAKFLSRSAVLQTDASSTTSSKKADSEQAEDPSRDKPVEDGPLEGDDLMKAALELNSYLVGTRTRLQRYIDPATGKLKPQSNINRVAAEDMNFFLAVRHEDADQDREEELRRTCRLVDTTLFRSYMYSRPEMAPYFFRVPNFCDPNVVGERLYEHGRYTELVEFFYGKRMHKQALELLRKFGTAPEPDEAAPTLHGPQRTIMYLKELPASEVDLILEHSEWTLGADPEAAMEVFIADTENAESLPRQKIVQFLAGIDPKLETRYLEHIIAELNDGTADLHDRLAELFILQLRQMEHGTAWDEIMERFLRFLRESTKYSLVAAYDMLPRDDPAFYDANIVVLRNREQHDKALEICVFKMQDYAKAEEYCNYVYKAQQAAASSKPARLQHAPRDDPEESSSSIYQDLLSLYLTPPSPYDRKPGPNLGPALDLLSKHGSRLPALSTLSLIPDNLPVRELESYFRARMRSATSMINESRIVAGLRDTERLTKSALLHLGEGAADDQAGRNRRVVISDERVCPTCHKRLGGSVVAVMPDNGVVHYGCVNGAAGGRPDSRRGPSWGRTG